MKFKLVDKCLRWFNNQKLLNFGKNGINLWVDGDGPCPKGWYHATTLEEAQEVLEGCLVWDMDVDFDIGAPLLRWLGETSETKGLNFWSIRNPTYHSDNPFCLKRLENLCERYGSYRRKKWL